MSLKYLIAAILISIAPDLSGQNMQAFTSDYILSETRLNLFSNDVREIRFSGQSLFAGLTQPQHLKINYYNKINHEVFFSGKMPTLNQLKNSMLENIELSADFSSALKFELKDNDEQGTDEESESFFSSSLFYFLGAAALATTFYILWQDNQNETTTRTFGYPPRPETDP